MPQRREGKDVLMTKNIIYFKTNVSRLEFFKHDKYIHNVTVPDFVD